MAWVAVEDSIREHDKIYKLADILNIPEAHAVGLMVCLWTWATAQAPNGDLTSFPQRAIARAAGWHKKNDKIFYEALFEANFLEKQSENKIFLRNWEERNEMLINYRERQKELNRQRQKRFRERKKAEKQQDNNLQPQQDSNANSNVTLTNSNAPTSHNTTIHNQTISKDNYHLSDISSLSTVENVENSETDDEISTIRQEFTEYIRRPTKADLETLTALHKEYSIDDIITAIYDGNEHGARSANYIQTILEGRE